MKLREIIAAQRPPGGKSDQRGGDAQHGPRWHWSQELLAGERDRFAFRWLAGRGDFGSMTLGASIEFDGTGRLVVTRTQASSVDAFVALALAELIAQDSRVQVVPCIWKECARLFVRDLHYRSRPQQGCCPEHRRKVRDGAERNDWWKRTGYSPKE